jgi:hypothetical protein
VNARAALFSASFDLVVGLVSGIVIEYASGQGGLRALFLAML